MIKYILPAEVLPLRSMVLRNGLSPDKCIFPTDEIADGFHLGYFVEHQLISIASFFPEDYPEKGDHGFRLRGMATNPEFAVKGFGAALIKFAAQELTSANASYIWSNARSSAVVFYKKQGYEIISDEFEVPGIGPHFNMLKSLK